MISTGITIENDVVVTLDSICEAAQRQFNSIMAPFNESYGRPLQENVVLDLIKRFIEWLKKLAADIKAFIVRAMNALRGRFESRVKRAEAMGVDPSIVEAVHQKMGAAANNPSTSASMTCGQLLRTEGWTHPTDTRKFEVSPCPGAGKAAQAISDYETAFEDLFRGLSSSPLPVAANTKFDKDVNEVLNRTANDGGFRAREILSLGIDRWYTGKKLEAVISSMWFMSAEKKMEIIEADIAAVQKQHPGERIAGKFEELKKIVESNNSRFRNPQAVVDNLRDAGNTVITFHNGIVKGILGGYQEMAVFMMECLTSVADKGIDGSAHRTPDVPAISYRETTEYLQEGLGSMIKNLATGDVEDQIKELTDEAKDIHTPEQQRYVITKIVRLLERLIILRHNPGGVRRYVHDSVSYFQRILGNEDAGKELSVRIGEAIRELAKLRDQVLAKKWNDDKWNADVEALKGKVSDLLDRAANRSASEDEF